MKKLIKEKKYIYEKIAKAIDEGEPLVQLMWESELKKVKNKIDNFKS